MKKLIQTLAESAKTVSKSEKISCNDFKNFLKIALHQGRNLCNFVLSKLEIKY